MMWHFVVYFELFHVIFIVLIITLVFVVVIMCVDRLLGICVLMSLGNHLVG